MTTEFQYDVFLKPNEADKPRVRRLAERLWAAGLRMWFDEWVIQPGDSFAACTWDFALSHAVFFRDPAIAVWSFGPCVSRLEDRARYPAFVDTRSVWSASGLPALSDAA